jgi:hypothetical protein
MVVRIDVPSIEVDGACDVNACAVVVSSLDAMHRRSTQILSEAVDDLLRNLRPGTVNRRCKRWCAGCKSTPETMRHNWGAPIATS